MLDRANQLGADPTVTNYGGGNSSCKAEVVHPATGETTTLLYVKGSGGDLGTLRYPGLAVLELDRLRRLDDRYQGVEHEDDMVDLFTFCSFGPGGAAPSIDTPMHGLVEATHVDHLHPDSVIALAAAADGERLVQECYGDRVRWVPWIRPGWELGKMIAEIVRTQPQAEGVVLGGHGLTTWGATSQQCEERALRLIREAAEFIERTGKTEPFGAARAARAPLPEADRRARAAQLAPILRGIAGTDSRVVGHFRDDEVVLDFLGREALDRLVPLGTSCPDHFLRTKVRPLLLDTAPNAPLEEVVTRLRELHAQYREEYAAYYHRHATADSPPMRGADPAIVLVPGVGMFSFGGDKQTARIAGEFYVNAINVMRGAEAVSTYAPVDESEKFRVEYWELEERKLRRRPKPKALAGQVALVTGGASGIGRATCTALAAQGACVVIADLDHEGARQFAKELGGPDVASAVRVDVSDEASVREAIEAACLSFGGLDIVVNNAGLSRSAPLEDTSTETWDLQFDVMARGSFLVSREAARVLRAQGHGGDIVYIASKNAVFAGPANIAYSSAKAAQAHQVRLLAAELGPDGVRVNGINPDGVVRGSGIFAGGWGAQRAAVYGVPEEKLGEYYAQRTLLKQEVLPEHVAAAVVALVDDSLPLTTGLLVPVDGGVPQAFLR
ncbi:bifunctional rhamnulose-1-phosphate aldolase/short-chain dehydrogenase [Micromonospora sp. MA102]|uniref:bifunctional rhamnulose-1-phosphate aldolase/short-chain dehydrogenase n=1 Tax=Micromonospora sp. MA102 TaxID=2952755 RepID=UPI0021C8D27B|nr:bifunctional rhamnulose-1-phosphate aldolase/short-chain dehydrogenase [Micromonospora sp. MA102]